MGFAAALAGIVIYGPPGAVIRAEGQMAKTGIFFRASTETVRQIAQLQEHEGQDNQSALIAAAVSERWQRQHQAIHFDLANGQEGRCPWCGYAPEERD